MNLIEKLGGYDRASKIANCKSGVVHPTKPLLDALLEYRRANNIFEVGDRVVILTMHIDNKFVHDVTKVLEDLVEVCGSYLYGSEIRHATDEEIKAGKRLEVS